MRTPTSRISRTLAVALAAPALVSTALAPASPAAGQEGPAAPLSLSDPDGQHLVLEALDVRTAVHGMLALTEMEIRFRNPHGRTMEGRFSAVLPEGATISRFANEVNGELVEGEVVERLRAHRIYDQILHRMRDPALLEQDQGDRFSARIFPIEADGTVRLVLAYSQLLPVRGGERGYVLALRGLPRVGRFSFRGRFHGLPGERPGAALRAASRPEGPDGARVVERSETDFSPREDMEVKWTVEPDAPAVRVLSAGGFYVASFRPRVAPSPVPVDGGRWVFYLDTSASGAEGAEHRIRALERVLAALPAGDRVEVRAFDHRVRVLGGGTAAQVARRVGPWLRDRLFLGGTDLEAALRDVAEQARRRPGTRFVLATDGVATLGQDRPAELRAAMARIPEGATVHALVLGARQDGATLRALTQGRGRIVEVPFSEDLERRSAQAAARLARPAGEAFTVTDPGAEWVLAAGAGDVLPGDEVLALGRLRPGGRAAPRLVHAGGEALEGVGAAPLPAGAFGPLLEREAYRAWLAELAEREAGAPTDSARRALAAEQVRLSVEHRVLIPRTTMLVLETEEDYDRFGLDRRALARVLTVGPRGVELLDRRPVRLAGRRAEPAEPAESAESGAEGFLGREAAAAQARSREVERGAAAAAEDLALESAVMPVVVPPPPPLSPSEPTPQAAGLPLDGLVVTAAGGEPARADSAGRAALPAWVSAAAPTAAEVDSLVRELRADPRDRERYNRLSEAQWAVGDWRGLRRTALAWQPYDPENPQVYEALGEAALRLGRREEAQRAYASLVEVAAARPELLQRAGLLLLRASAAELAVAPMRRALESRPDRVNGYRHLALVLWRLGREEEAAAVLEEATRQVFPGWYGDARRIVREELGYVYRAWGAKERSRRGEIARRAAERDVDLERTDALRVTLAWETDGNDVDLHVVDPLGNECYYGNRRTPAGLELYEDITQGFGPEVVRTDALLPGTYHVGVRYYSAGPMGVSRGILVVLRPEADGSLPDVQILPFRLVEGGGDIRALARVEVSPKE